MFPVMNLSLVGSASLRQKVFIARELQDRLEAISEVLGADLEGAPEEVLEGVIDKSKIAVIVNFFLFPYQATKSSGAGCGRSF